MGKVGNPLRVVFIERVGGRLCVVFVGVTLGNFKIGTVLSIIQD